MTTTHNTSGLMELEPQQLNQQATQLSQLLKKYKSIQDDIKAIFGMMPRIKSHFEAYSEIFELTLKVSQDQKISLSQDKQDRRSQKPQQDMIVRSCLAQFIGNIKHLLKSRHGVNSHQKEDPYDDPEIQKQLETIRFKDKNFVKKVVLELIQIINHREQTIESMEEVLAVVGCTRNYERLLVDQEDLNVVDQPSAVGSISTVQKTDCSNKNENDLRISQLKYLDLQINDSGSKLKNPYLGDNHKRSQVMSAQDSSKRLAYPQTSNSTIQAKNRCYQFGMKGIQSTELNVSDLRLKLRQSLQEGDKNQQLDLKEQVTKDTEIKHQKRNSVSKDQFKIKVKIVQPEEQEFQHQGGDLKVAKLSKPLSTRAKFRPISKKIKLSPAKNQDQHSNVQKQYQEGVQSIVSQQINMNDNSCNNSAMCDEFKFEQQISYRTQQILENISKMKTTSSGLFTQEDKIIKLDSFKNTDPFIDSEETHFSDIQQSLKHTNSMPSLAVDVTNCSRKQMISLSPSPTCKGNLNHNATLQTLFDSKPSAALRMPLRPLNLNTNMLHTFDEDAQAEEQKINFGYLKKMPKFDLNTSQKLKINSPSIKFETNSIQQRSFIRNFKQFPVTPHKMSNLSPLEQNDNTIDFQRIMVSRLPAISPEKLNQKKSTSFGNNKQ